MAFCPNCGAQVEEGVAFCPQCGTGLNGPAPAPIDYYDHTAEFHPQDIYTGVAPGNNVAKRLYESVGFKDTGLSEFGMEEMRMIY